MFRRGPKFSHFFRCIGLYFTIQSIVIRHIHCLSLPVIPASCHPPPHQNPLFSLILTLSFPSCPLIPSSSNTVPHPCFFLPLSSSSSLLLLPIPSPHFSLFSSSLSLLLIPLPPHPSPSYFFSLLPLRLHEAVVQLVVQVHSL